LTKGTKGRSKVTQRHEGRERNADLPRLLTCGAEQFLRGQIKLARDQFGTGQQALTRLGQADAAWAAHQKRHARIVFELSQRFGQRGLRDKHLPGGRPNAAVLDNAHEGPQLVKAQIHGQAGLSGAKRIIP
jgi:hypothetical protein